MTLWNATANRVRCMRTTRVLQSYLDGALDDVAAQRVAEHLEACRRCGLEASVYQEIKTTLRHRDRSVDPVTLERLRRFGEQLAQGDQSSSGDHGA